jgi:hypothetical protein
MDSKVFVFLSDFGDLYIIDEMVAYAHAARMCRLFGWDFVPF